MVEIKQNLDRFKQVLFNWHTPDPSDVLLDNIGGPDECKTVCDSDRECVSVVAPCLGDGEITNCTLSHNRTLDVSDPENAPQFCNASGDDFERPGKILTDAHVNVARYEFDRLQPVTDFACWPISEEGAHPGKSIGQATTRTWDACAQICLGEKSTCDGFQYNEGTHHCTLYDILGESSDEERVQALEELVDTQSSLNCSMRGFANTAMKTSETMYDVYWWDHRLPGVSEDDAHEECHRMCAINRPDTKTYSLGKYIHYSNGAKHTSCQCWSNEPLPYFSRGNDYCNAELPDVRYDFAKSECSRSLTKCRKNSPYAGMWEYADYWSSRCGRGKVLRCCKKERQYEYDEEQFQFVIHRFERRTFDPSEPLYLRVNVAPGEVYDPEYKLEARLWARSRNGRGAAEMLSANWELAAVVEAKLASFAEMQTITASALASLEDPLQTVGRLFEQTSLASLTFEVMSLAAQASEYILLT
ncbi:unnamed protein product, partial [Durusdinium trenchii]